MNITLIIYIVMLIPAASILTVAIEAAGKKRYDAGKFSCSLGSCPVASERCEIKSHQFFPAEDLIAHQKPWLLLSLFWPAFIPALCLYFTVRILAKISIFLYFKCTHALQWTYTELTNPKENV